MRRRCRLLALMLLVVLAHVVGACTEEGESATSTTASSATPATTTSMAERSTTTEATPATAVPMLEPIDGVLRVGLVGGSVTTNNFWAYLDPESSVQNGYVLGQSHPALYTISIPDFLHVPSLAREPAPELADDGGAWTATIPMRKGMTWSDGEPVTADDFVFTVNTNAEFALGSNWISFHPFQVADDPETEDVNEEVRWAQSIEAVDDYTVKITFAPSEDPPGLAIYQNGILFHPIMPQHFWASVVDGCRAEMDPKACLYAADGAGVPSAGTMIFDSWEPGVGASIVANPGYYYRGVTYSVYANGVYTQTGGVHDLDEAYFGEPGGQIVSQYADGPFVEEVHFIEYDSQENALLAFLRGDVHFVFGVAFGTVEAEIGERLWAEPDIEVARSPSEAFRYLAFNLRKAPMNDPAFRRALALMLDKEYVAEEVLAAEVSPIYGIVPELNTAWHTGDVATWGRGMSDAERLDAAVQMLAEAGYAWTTNPEPVEDEDGNPTGEFIDGEGLTQPDGTPMPELELLTPAPDYDPLMSAFAVAIDQGAGRLGVPIIRNPADIDTIVDAVLPPKTPEEALGWDMYMFYWGGGDPSLPCTSHQAFFGADQDAVTGGGFNTPGYNDAEFEALSDAHDLATSIEEARGICADMERNIAENLPYIVLFTTPITDAWQIGVEFPITRVLGGIGGYPNGWLGQVRVGD